MKKIFYSTLFWFFLAGALYAQHTTYDIKEGETLEDISKKFNVSKEAILKLNPELNSKNLAYKTIVLPAREATEKTPNASRIQFKEYRVMPKETLYSLAKRFGTSVEDLRKYNPHLYEAELAADELIKIPIYEKEMEKLNASVQTSTFENLIHIVMPKETKYGISKQYQMSVEELEELNPFTKIKELQPGQFLRVTNPFAVKKEREFEFEYYKVAPKETFYSLTRELEISQDSLEKLNPILKELGLQAGMELRVPIKSDDLVKGESALHSLKIDLSKDLRTADQQNVVVLLPFRLYNVDTSLEKENEDEEDSKVEEGDVIRKDSYLQISLDLYSGIKLALNDANEMGIPVKAEVLDTERNSSKLSRLLTQSYFDDAQIVIGPLLPTHIEQVAKHLSQKNTAIFSPLSSSDVNGSSKIFQTRPSNAAKEDLLISYLNENKEGKNFMILKNSDNEGFANKLSARIAGVKTVQQAAQSYLQRSDLSSLMSEDKPNWIVIETSDIGAISNAVSNLNAMRHEYEIRVFTTDRSNFNKAEVESEFLSNLNFTYTSVDRGDALDASEDFVRKYKSQYGINPSSYATRGYDITMDAILRSVSNPSFSNNGMESDRYTEYVENRFSYQPKSADGFYNNAVYLIQFSENLELKVLN